MAESAREIDLNPRTYVGLSFPLRSDNNNDFALTKNSLEQSRHNLKNLLLTHVGERVGQPEFGSNLRALCFEPNDNNLPEKIETLESELKLLETLLNKENLYNDNKKTFDDTIEKISKVKKDLSSAEERWLQIQILNDEIKNQ